MDPKKLIDQRNEYVVQYHLQMPSLIAKLKDYNPQQIGKNQNSLALHIRQCKIYFKGPVALASGIKSLQYIYVCFIVDDSMHPALGSDIWVLLNREENEYIVQHIHNMHTEVWVSAYGRKGCVSG